MAHRGVIAAASASSRLADRHLLDDVALGGSAAVRCPD